MTEDILVLLNPRNYVDLQKVLKENHPASSYVAYMITCLIEWNKIKAKKGPEWYPKISTEIQMRSKIYVPRTGLQFGTFLCINEKNTNHPYCVSFFSLQETQEELIKCLNDTKLIDWSMNPIFNAVQNGQLAILQQLVKKNNFQLNHDVSFKNYRMPKDKLFLIPKVQIIDGYKMVKLSPANSEEMNDLWPNNFENSEKWIKFLLHFNGGFGIRNDKGELVACISRDEFFSEGMLAVKESERNESFAQALMIMNCKYFVKKYEMDPICSVNDSDIQTKSVATQMGYQQIGGTIGRYKTIPLLKSRL